MRSSAVVREAWLNVSTGTTRAIVLALIMVTASVALNLADLVAVRQIDERARDFQTSGASVLILSSQGHVDGELCTALATQPGVRAAGALRRAPATTLAALPQQSVPVFEVSPGFERLLHAESSAASGSGVVLSRDAADAVGVPIGGTVHTASGSARVSGIYDYPQDGRARGYGYGILESVPASGAFDECWVDQWPGSPAMRSLIRGVRTPGVASADVPLTVGQLNTTRGASLDAHLLFADRLTAWALPLAAVVALGLSIFAVRSRRLEHASALHLGVSSRAILGIAMMETGMWMLPTAVAGGLVAAAYASSGLPTDAGAATLLAAAIPVACVLGAALGTALAVFSVKESHLFRYFKER